MTPIRTAMMTAARMSKFFELEGEEGWLFMG
jgi:hypothetical protein